MVERFSPLNYWSGKQVKSITPEDELLILFIKIHLEIPHYDIVGRYSVSQTTIQNAIIIYLHALHDVLFGGFLEEIPSLTQNKCSIPASFTSTTNCTDIID